MKAFGFLLMVLMLIRCHLGIHANAIGYHDSRPAVLSSWGSDSVEGVRLDKRMD